MPEPDLLITKFTVPPVRSTLLARSHLLDILDQSRSAPLTLLSASAGFGKTTLLSAWASQSTRRVAWLTLDEQDNDPARFWAYVIAALRKAGSPVGEAAEALLHSPQPSLLTGALTSLINDLTALAWRRSRQVSDTGDESFSLRGRYRSPGNAHGRMDRRTPTGSPLSAQT